MKTGGVTAVKFVMSFSYDSEALGHNFHVQKVKDYVRLNFYGATIIFASGVFEKKPENSGQLVVWLRNEWFDSNDAFFGVLDKMIVMSQVFGQQSILIELFIVEKSGKTLQILLEVKNKPLVLLAKLRQKYLKTPYGASRWYERYVIQYAGVVKKYEYPDSVINKEVFKHL